MRGGGGGGVGSTADPFQSLGVALAAVVRAAIQEAVGQISHPTPSSWYPSQKPLDDSVLGLPL